MIKSINNITLNDTLANLPTNKAETLLNSALYYIISRTKNLFINKTTFIEGDFIASASEKSISFAGVNLDFFGYYAGCTIKLCGLKNNGFFVVQKIDVDKFFLYPGEYVFDEMTRGNVARVDIPAEVLTLAQNIAIDLLNRTGEAEISAEKIGNYSVNYTVSALGERAAFYEKALEPFKKFSFWG
jgi:hypothetical protein